MLIIFFKVIFTLYYHQPPDSFSCTFQLIPYWGENHLHQQQQKQKEKKNTEAPATSHTNSTARVKSRLPQPTVLIWVTGSGQSLHCALRGSRDFTGCDGFLRLLWLHALRKTWASAHFYVKPTNVLSIKPFILLEADTAWQRKEKRRWSGKGAAMFLFQLPEDVLFLVLSYLDPRSLCRLSQACKRSYQFISRDVVWRKIAKDIINTGLTRQGIDL